jgi:hypothetical protein
MTKAEFLAALAAVPETGTALAAFFEEQETASKEEVSKRNRENQNLRARLKAAEDGGAGKEKLESILAKLGLEEGAEEDAVEAAIEKIVAGKGGNESVVALQKRLDRLERERKVEREKLESVAKSERGKRHDLIRLKELQDALMANKAASPEALAKLLLSVTKVREDDDAIMLVTDKGEEVAVAEGVKGYLDSFPAFRLNDQKGGAGSGSGAGGGAAGGKIDPGEAMAKALAAKGAAADKAASDAQATFFKNT